METILITGGTGMIGRYLTKLLVKKGYRVTWLSRKAGETYVDGNLISIYSWNIHEQTIDEAAITGADHIIHLAGAGVADKRWTEARKKEILDSRTQSSELLVRVLQKLPNKVKTVVSASAIGWYGPDREDVRLPFTEDMPAYPGFLGDTCKAWEESIAQVADSNKRLVRLRVGIVLSETGGAIAEFKKPIAAGILPIFGTGKQVVSWIHIEDLCKLFIYAIENPEIAGIYNAVAPNPVSSRNLMKALAKNMRRSWAIPIPIPAFFLKLLLGEMSIEILKSTTVSSRKIQATGFTFQFPQIEEATRL